MMARVLVAEDEEPLRLLLDRALREAGHTVVLAGDGAEALDILGHSPAAFDLILADIKMPIMDGIALALAAARDHPQTRILLMTGYADQRERAHGLDQLTQGVISKPFTLDEIRTAVSAALAGRV